MEQNKLIGANALRILLGDVSDMTVWRWLKNPELGFPRPVYIARRRYWKEAEVLAWIEAQSERGAA